MPQDARERSSRSLRADRNAEKSGNACSEDCLSAELTLRTSRLSFQIFTMNVKGAGKSKSRKKEGAEKECGKMKIMQEKEASHYQKVSDIFRSKKIWFLSTSFSTGATKHTVGGQRTEIGSEAIVKEAALESMEGSIESESDKDSEEKCQKLIGFPIVESLSELRMQLLITMDAWSCFDPSRKWTDHHNECNEAVVVLNPDSADEAVRATRTGCSRLSVNPAHDASEWRLPRGVRGENDGLPCYLGNGDAGTSLGNPDIRVPYRTKREDGLTEEENTDDEEDTETTEEEEKEEATEDEERKANDDARRNGNRVVPTEAADQRGTEGNGDIREDRHAPGGTWLTKVRSFLKDSILKKRESCGRRGKGGTVREEGGEKLGGNGEETRGNKREGYIN
ncbi:hypothetical protein NDU88_006258 [Pleurodeles waltl]|uniref:Uncharacterized protein n=1 Tax=Pleurodeles waltl TaxID=8319 RepID=A0AAV7SP08_PLEWA|nr:hypothetical protein NDU88_006258 [Pleurodeles waltl]